MRYLKVKRILALHRIVIDHSGGSHGLRDSWALSSAVAQTQMTFDQIDLYPTLAAKAAALCYSLVHNHPFIDGNKRIGQAAMEEILIKMVMKSRLRLMNRKKSFSKSLAVSGQERN